MVNLEEVHLDRRVEESLVGRCHGTGLDFLHGDDVLAVGGRKKGAEITPQASQTKLQLPVDAHELDGKERRGMVLLFVSLGRNIKTMLSSTNLGVGFPYTVVGRHAVRAACQGGVVA